MLTIIVIIIEYEDVGKAYGIYEDVVDGFVERDYLVLTNNITKTNRRYLQLL